VDNCAEAVDQVKTCLRMKMGKSDVERIAMFDRLERKNAHSPSAGVWNPRTDPRSAWAQASSSSSSSEAL